YHVGRTSLNQAKNRKALKPGEQDTAPPAARLLKVAAISPWMWNSGMMLRQTSSGVSARIAPTLQADAVTLMCRSGTIFGRDVVPEVCSTSATSSAAASPGRAAVPASLGGGCNTNAPAGPSAS